jgi:hypothetical protein
MYYRDMDLIQTCKGSLRKQIQHRPIAEVHMAGLTTRDRGNFLTESRINDIKAMDKRNKEAVARETAKKVF